MSEPSSTAAVSALEELLEVSPQVEAAVIITRDDRHLIAATPALTPGMADRFAATSGRILDAADQARTELGREAVAQVEVATPDGHVFVTADATHVIAAVTATDPTVGLIFYDLKSALRALREAGTSTVTRSDAAQVVVPLTESTEHEASPDEDAPDATTTSVKAGRWRRRKA